MINKFLILVIALIVANVSFASTSELVLVSHSISKHPKVMEKANEITLKGINIDQLLAEDGLKINLSTKSKLSIKHNLNVNQSRADDLDREFLDGVVTINKNIYDFGVVEYKKNAEVLRKEALKLEYQQVFSTTLQKLLNIVNDVARVKTVLVKLRSDLVKTKASIDEVKLRFTSGIGTVMDVRQAQLSLLDLETEIQTLRRDRDTNLVILRDEFSLSQSDLKLINSAINQFNNKLTANKQDVALVINQLINYQRSVDIINLEKSALNSQIKSLKSENMPQLSASVTGIAYDVTRGLDEYELYGGINLAMPLFDSGLSKVKQRGLTYRIKVQNDMMNALNQDKSLALNKLIKKYKNLQIEKNNAVQKQANLTEKLSQIIQRMAVVDEGLLSKLQTQLQLAKIKRDLLAYPYHIKSINIDYWSLNEQLIEKIGIHPTK
jgi:outer membrane protein TolC